jgi:hypothetical protein
MKHRLLLLVASSLLLTNYLYAETGVFSPSSSDVFITSTTNGEFTCARQDEDSSWLVGYQDKKGVFRSVASIIAKKKKQLKVAKDSRKIAKLKKDIAKEKKQLKLGAPVCAKGPGLTSDPTPTPGSSTPTPTPTSNPNTCFNGDLSKPGCFGLPAGASGNKRSGATYWDTFCTGCHASKANINYSQLLTSFNRPEMIGFKPNNNQDIYDLVAWLNRFTL